ncbi:unnamed protein product [Acidocella sp. C78]|nr:unnamed protein product [Acidocella sp. C78]
MREGDLDLLRRMFAAAVDAASPSRRVAPHLPPRRRGGPW